MRMASQSHAEVVLQLHQQTRATAQTSELRAFTSPLTNNWMSNSWVPSATATAYAASHQIDSGTSIQGNRNGTRRAPAGGSQPRPRH